MIRLARLGCTCLTCKQPVYGKPARHPDFEQGWLRPVCRHCRSNRNYLFLVKVVAVTTVRVINPGRPPASTS